MSDSEEDYSTNFDTLPTGDKYHNQWEALGAWFLGPKAENGEMFSKFVQQAIDGCVGFRRDYFPQDSVYITEKIKESKPYKAEVSQIEVELGRIIKDMQNTIPFYSTRYQGHMNWDTSLPATIGYIAGLLYNQNNCASEGGPATTLMEIEVGIQLCKMLGYNTEAKSNGPKGWGHLTCGGTVANMEALWAARNLKFYPIAIRNAVRDEPRLKNAKNFTVRVLSEKRGNVNILEADNWDLLNISVDDAINMASDVEKMAGVSKKIFNDIVDKFSLQTIGLAEFMKVNKLDHAGVVVAPASNHYSWPKGLTLLGLGGANLRGVELDEYGRQSMTSLRDILEDCLEKKIPIIMSVAVMGSTEEGAIDPLTDILMMRAEYSRKGLNWVQHADAAWGGYLCTMLHREEEAENYGISRTKSIFRKKGAGTEYVVTMPLNEHSRSNLLAMGETDSITVDPHKTGLIPYPAGGLCYRNGSMRGFVTLTAPVVFHGGSDPNIGVFGIEGSKPGAAAVSTLLSHRVLGLDMNGYGRIMAQCISGAKMFYCLWTCLAQDTDNFVCAPIRPLPPHMSVDNAKRFMRTKIINKSYMEIVKDQTVLNFLAEVGPDAMVNSFAVNIRGNTDTLLANKLNHMVFQRLSYTSSLKKNHRRVQMYITKTERNEVMGMEALNSYKKRIGLPPGPEVFSMLIATCMNPWETSGKHLSFIKNIFRETVMNSIGQLTDTPHHHAFTSVSLVNKDDQTIYADYNSVFSSKERQYQAIVKFKILDKKDAEIIRAEQEKLAATGEDSIFFGNKDIMTLGSLVYSEGRTLRFDFFSGWPSFQKTPISAEVVVEDIIKYRNLMACEDAVVDTSRFWLFGDKEGTYLSHYMSQAPDYQQVGIYSNYFQICKWESYI